MLRRVKQLERKLMNRYGKETPTVYFFDSEQEYEQDKHLIEQPAIVFIDDYGEDV